MSACLERRAKAGDKWAQLEPGIRCDEGQGVRADLDRARRLYRQAATSGGGTFYICSPHVGKAPGGVIPVARPRAPAPPKPGRFERLGDGR
jgi:hypothetical protein